MNEEEQVEHHEDVVRDLSQEMTDRLAKLEAIRNLEIAYKDHFDRTHVIRECLDLATAEPDKVLEQLEEIDTKTDAAYKICGRLMRFRNHGNLSFAQLQDISGQMQLAFSKKKLGAERYQYLLKLIDAGDFVGVSGRLFMTKHGEITLYVFDVVLLSKTVRPMPEKYHGIADKELAYRYRYLETMTSPEAKDRFLFRSHLTSHLRRFFEDRSFLEVETPILATKASGALALPFQTHHNALDIDMYLRVAPETYLKRMVVGGYEKVFEVAKCFRNEGIDPSHLQEFTQVEAYWSYVNYESWMELTEELMEYLMKTLLNTDQLSVAGRDGAERIVSFARPYQRMTLRECIMNHSEVDIDEYPTREGLAAKIRSLYPELDGYEQLGRGNMIDFLYKKVARPHITGPLFLTHHPLDISPLARKNDTNGATVDRFQLVLNGWEVCNAYSELIDPVDQRERFLGQESARAHGDVEAHMSDEDFLRAMEHGMPPMAGWGMGIDRLCALLLKQDNLRDIVYFPMMRPVEE